MIKTRIDKGLWWDRAWTLVEGCTPVSRACEHCWAASATHMRARQTNAKIHARYEGLTTDNRRFNGHVRLMPDSLTVPLHVRQPTSWAIWNDLFHESVPFDFIDRAFAVMALCPQHDFYVLTKRPKIMAEYTTEVETRRSRIVAIMAKLGADVENHPFVYNSGWPLPNIPLGTSIEDQPTADERLGFLLQCSAAVHFASYEPALGPVDFLQVAAGPLCPQNPQHRIDVLRGGTWNMRSGFIPAGQPEFVNHSDMPATLDWVIAGGESGPGARPAHPDWFRAARDQCQAAGKPFFFKQWGMYVNIPPVEMQNTARQAFVCRDCGMSGDLTDEAIGVHRETGCNGETIAMYRIPKKRAGRLLDGRTWDQLPQQQGVGSRE